MENRTTRSPLGRQIKMAVVPTEGSTQSALNTNGTFTIVVSLVGGNCQPRTRREMHAASPGYPFGSLPTDALCTPPLGKMVIVVRTRAVVGAFASRTRRA